MKDCDIDSPYNVFRKIGAIEELEEIKEEMLEDIVITLKDETDKVILEHNKTIYSNIAIIDKRISKLKGEQK